MINLCHWWFVIICWTLFVISTVIAAGVYTGWMQFVAMNELMHGASRKFAQLFYFPNCLAREHTYCTQSRTGVWEIWAYLLTTKMMQLGTKIHKHSQISACTHTHAHIKCKPSKQANTAVAFRKVFQVELFLAAGDFPLFILMCSHRVCVQCTSYTNK